MEESGWKPDELVIVSRSASLGKCVSGSNRAVKKTDGSILEPVSGEPLLDIGRKVAQQRLAGGYCCVE